MLSSKVISFITFFVVIIGIVLTVSAVPLTPSSSLVSRQAKDVGKGKEAAKVGKEAAKVGKEAAKVIDDDEEVGKEVGKGKEAAKVIDDDEVVDDDEEVGKGKEVEAPFTPEEIEKKPEILIADTVPVSSDGDGEIKLYDEDDVAKIPEDIEEEGNSAEGNGKGQ